MQRYGGVKAEKCFHLINKNIRVYEQNLEENYAFHVPEKKVTNSLKDKINKCEGNKCSFHSIQSVPFSLIYMSMNLFKPSNLT